MSRWSTLGVWGACAFIIQPVVWGYASCLGLVVVLSLYGRIVLALYLKTFSYLKALELLGMSVFLKNDEKSDTYNEWFHYMCHLYGV